MKIDHSALPQILYGLRRLRTAVANPETALDPCETGTEFEDIRHLWHMRCEALMASLGGQDPISERIDRSLSLPVRAALSELWAAVSMNHSPYDDFVWALDRDRLQVFVEDIWGRLAPPELSDTEEAIVAVLQAASEPLQADAIRTRLRRYGADVEPEHFRRLLAPKGRLRRLGFITHTRGKGYSASGTAPPM